MLEFSLSICLCVLWVRGGCPVCFGGILWCLRFGLVFCFEWCDCLRCCALVVCSGLAWIVAICV